MRNRSVNNVLMAGLLFLGLGACNLDHDDPRQPLLAIGDGSPSQTFSVGGTVVGATGPFVLLNSNGTTLNVVRDGSFRFDTPMVPSALYNVTVAVPPNFQTCVVANGAGTMELANISDVRVTCVPAVYTAANTLE